MRRSGRFGDYLPVAARIASGKQRAQALLNRAGREASPITIVGRQEVNTFWGQAWCRHIERYSDFANRLPRGRTLVRNGSVVDLLITKGQVQALVCGSELYEVQINIQPAPTNQWRGLVQACAGRIDSVVELLAGRISDAVMTVLTDPKQGLFPDPTLINFKCSCPDAARLCKHIAAAFYGIGARLDAQPELLFLLRDVDPNDLVHMALETSTNVVATPSASMRLLAPDVVAELFGVDWDAPPKPSRRRRTTR